MGLFDWGTWGWILLGTGAGAILASLLIPGFSDMLGQVFSFMSRVIFWMLSSLPKPIKVLIFLVLFFSISTLIFNFTVGASYMCYQDATYAPGYSGSSTEKYEGDIVYKIPLIKGMMLNFWEFMKGDYISVELLFTEDNKVPAKDDEEYKQAESSTHAFVDTLEEDGREYNVLHALVPLTVFKLKTSAFSSMAKLSELPPNQQFEATPSEINDKQYKVYQICYDKYSETCLLRPSEYGEGPFIDVGVVAPDGAVTDTECIGAWPWSGAVGIITYKYYEDDKNRKEGNITFVSGVIDSYVETRIIPYRNQWKYTEEGELTLIGRTATIWDTTVWFFKDLFGINTTEERRLQELESITKNGATECHFAKDDYGRDKFEKEQGLLGSLPGLDSQFDDFYMPAYRLLLDKEGIPIKYYYDEKYRETVIYNAAPAPLMVSRDCKDDAKGTDACTQVQGKQGKLFFDSKDGTIREIKEEIKYNADVGDEIRYGKKKLVNIVCNEETTEAPFDTKMLVLGIDILNPKYMVFFVLFGTILSFFAFLSRFR